MISIFLKAWKNRLQRGIGTRLKFTDDTSMPNNFRDFKNSLNEYFAKQIIIFHSAHEKEFVVTFRENVLCKNIVIDSSSAIYHCTSEEADQS